MKKSNFLNLTLIFIIGLSLVAFLRAVGEDDGLAFDILSKNNDIFPNDGLLPDFTPCRGIFYEYSYGVISPEPLILYLERQEKSPPRSAALS